MLRISNEALTFDDVLLVPGYSDVTAGIRELILLPVPVAHGKILT